MFDLTVTWRIFVSGLNLGLNLGFEIGINIAGELERNVNMLLLEGMNLTIPTPWKLSLKPFGVIKVHVDSWFMS